MQPERPLNRRPSAAREVEVQRAIAPVPGQCDRPVALAPLNGVLVNPVYHKPVIREERERLPAPVLKAGFGRSLLVSHGTHRPPPPDRALLPTIPGTPTRQHHA